MVSIPTPQIPIHWDDLSIAPHIPRGHRFKQLSVSGSRVQRDLLPQSCMRLVGSIGVDQILTKELGVDP